MVAYSRSDFHQIKGAREEICHQHNIYDFQHHLHYTELVILHCPVVFELFFHALADSCGDGGLCFALCLAHAADAPLCGAHVYAFAEKGPRYGQALFVYDNRQSAARHRPLFGPVDFLCLGQSVVEAQMVALGARQAASRGPEEGKGPEEPQGQISRPDPPIPTRS